MVFANCADTITLSLFIGIPFGTQVCWILPMYLSGTDYSQIDSKYCKQRKSNAIAKCRTMVGITCQTKTRQSTRRRQMHSYPRDKCSLKRVCSDHKPSVITDQWGRRLPCFFLSFGSNLGACGGFDVANRKRNVPESLYTPMQPLTSMNL